MTQLPLNFGRAPLPDRDRLPEHTNYRDTGCGVYHACLSCPLMTCVLVLEDAELDSNRAFREHRDRLLCRRYKEVRATTHQRGAIELVAGEFAVHRRTAERIIARQKRRPEALEGREESRESATA